MATKRKRRKINKERLILVGTIVVSSFCLIGYACSKYFADNVVSTEMGIEKIKELESVDVASIRNKIEEINNKKLEKEKEKEKNLEREKLEKESKKDQDFNELFENSVIMGDSRVEGLIDFDILSPSSVVAHKGRNVVTAKEDVYKVADLSPKNIFMSYGVNDLEMFSSSEEFIGKYKELIKDVQVKLPDSKIYILSIIPTEQKAIDKNPKLKNVTSFNEGIVNMCNELKVGFIDEGQSINLGNNLYAGDGIHFNPDFYKGYLNILKEKVNL